MDPKNDPESEIDPTLEELGLNELIAIQPVAKLSAEIDEVLHLAVSGRRVLLKLNRLAQSPASAVRGAAETAQLQMYGMLSPPPVHQEEVSNLPFRIGRWIERALTNLRVGLGPVSAKPATSSGRFRTWWTWGGILASLLIALMVATQQWWIAVIVLLLRLGISLLVGPSNLPYEGPTPDGKASVVVYRCLAGHLSDAIVLIGIASLFVNDSLAAQATLTVGAITAMLSASLLRVASLQVGVQVSRLTVERVVRAGSLLLALCLVAFVPSNPGLLVLAALGALSYAGIEVVRTVVRLRLAERTFGGLLPDVRLTVTSAGELSSRTLINQVERPHNVVELEGLRPAV
jgi:hypothetical protein